MTASVTLPWQFLSQSQTSIWDDIIAKNNAASLAVKRVPISR